MATSTPGPVLKAARSGGRESFSVASRIKPADNRTAPKIKPTTLLFVFVPVLVAFVENDDEDDGE